MTLRIIRHLLVSDLAGAVIGPPDSLDDFRQWVSCERGYMPLVYHTRYSTPDPKKLAKDLGSPKPDFLIAGFGTEIFDFSRNDWVSEWIDLQESIWNANQARHHIQSLMPDVEFRPEPFPSCRTVRVHVKDRVDEWSREIENALAREGIAAQLHSVGTQLDIAPKAVDQVAAMKFLARQLELSDSRVIVCGGEESGPAAFLGPFAGVLVANSTITVPRAVSVTPSRSERGSADAVYRSPFRYADGIIDGVQYWREQWSDRGESADHPDRDSRQP